MISADRLQHLVQTLGPRLIRLINQEVNLLVPEASTEDKVLAVLSLLGHVSAGYLVQVPLKGQLAYATLIGSLVSQHGGQDE